jgi:hypothetical protein
LAAKQHALIEAGRTEALLVQKLDAQQKRTDALQAQIKETATHTQQQIKVISLAHMLSLALAFISYAGISHLIAAGL